MEIKGMLIHLSMAVYATDLPMLDAIQRAKRELADTLLNELLKQPDMFTIDQLGGTTTVTISTTFVSAKQRAQYQHAVAQVKQAVGLL